MTEQPPRLFYPALTGLRFVAASMVFVLHYKSGIFPAAPVWLANLLGEFHTGVAIFFVLSGFLITHQYLHYNFTSVSKYSAYLLIRLGRILPLYIPVFLEVHSRWLFAVPDLFLHLTLLKGFFKKVHLTGVIQSWTLTVELTFYVLAPLLFWLARKGTLLLPYIFALLTGIILTGIGFGLSTLGHNPFGFMPDFAFTALSTFFGRATEFFVGMGLAYYINSQHNISRISAPVTGFFTYSGLGLFWLLLFLISTGANGNQAGINTWYGLLLHNLFLPLGIGLLLFGLMYEKTWLSQILSSRLFILLGNASYAFYLLHLGRAGNIAGELTRNMLPLQFLLLWGFSISIYLVWEKPIYKLIKVKVQAALS
ncbi:acyltransferase family protein [Adhaeribacter rhizoryzae]|uniref:Acyltransferase n=1 Tax=Adhaeribacter rhizoryzae TaxID=2607907 RepID=A0A5M6DQW7_9BACT|nr:acyltransferase [Adhaeribacter rhizoryzae]KAA5548590.1 acyltransferase [Adhaeribacter rhizoryzae]